MIGETLSQRESQRGNEKTARQSLEHGANIRARDGKGKTPLQVASALRNQGIVVPLQYGAEGAGLASLITLRASLLEVKAEGRTFNFECLSFF